MPLKPESLLCISREISMKLFVNFSPLVEELFPAFSFHNTLQNHDSCFLYFLYKIQQQIHKAPLSIFSKLSIFVFILRY